MGAGGFIGREVSSHLSDLGHEVHRHIRSESGSFGEADLPRPVDAVVNAAGRLGGEGVNYSALTESNRELPKMLARLCAERGIHYVHIGTPGVCGLLPGVREDSDPAPWGPYEETKQQGELAVRKLMAGIEAQYVILRPDFVYGPGDMHKLPLFQRAAGRLFPLVGRNGARLRPTFVTDACRAVAMSLPGGPLAGGGTVNVGGPDVVTVRELVLAIAESAGTRARPVGIPRWLMEAACRLPLRPRALSASRVRLLGDDHFVDITRAESLGFLPEWGVRRGVGRTVEWYAGHGLLEKAES